MNKQEIMKRPNASHNFFLYLLIICYVIVECWSSSIQVTNGRSGDEEIKRGFGVGSIELLIMRNNTAFISIPMLNTWR